MKYLNNADGEALLQMGCDKDHQMGEEDSQERNHDQTLIWALRKELAAKTKLISELKNQVSQQSEQPRSSTPRQYPSIESQSLDTDGSPQQQLHQIYEQKLADALDREREQMRVEFEAQLEGQVAAIRDQSNQMIELRTNEIELEFELKS